MHFETSFLCDYTHIKLKYKARLEKKKKLGLSLTVFIFTKQTFCTTTEVSLIRTFRDITLQENKYKCWRQGNTYYLEDTITYFEDRNM